MALLVLSGYKIRSLKPHTIEWQSDKHTKDYSKAFFTWDKAAGLP